MTVFERSEITAGEAARILGISRQAVYKRAMTGRLIPSGRTLDGVYVFSRKHIEEVKAKDDARRAAGEAEEGEAEA